MRWYGAPSARISAAIAAPSASAVANARTTGSGPSSSVGRRTFSAPPSFGTSRLASSSTCGVER